jgi:hypothetical protein
MPGLVESLEGHPSGHRAVPNDGYYPVCIALHEFAGGKTQGRGDGGAGVPNTKGIVWALAPFGKAADAPMRSDGMKPAPSTRYQFVSIRLMADIPNDQVLWGIKYVVQSQGQFHRSQIRRQMTAVAGNSTDNFISDLFSQLVKFFDGQRLEILRTVYPRQKRLSLLL